MSITLNSYEFSVFGNKAVVIADVTFDSSYSYGGESLDPEVNFGLHAVDFAIIESKAGFNFEYDRTNKKIKATTPIPPIVFEERQTIASNSITLNYPPAFIMSISQASAPLSLTTSGATLAAGQVKPSAVFAAGERATLTFHSGVSGVVYITYITQAWKEVWDNLVQEEAVTVTTNVGTLANQAVAIQAINFTGTTSGNCALMLDKDDTVATLECKVNMTSTNKALTFYATDAVTSAVVTYIKKPASGFLYERAIAEESLSTTSNICTPAYPILIWGYSGQLPENGATTETFISLTGTAGTGEAKLDLVYPGTRIKGESVSAGTGMYVWGTPNEIVAQPLEIANGMDLSGVTNVRMLLIGT